MRYLCRAALLAATLAMTPALGMSQQPTTTPQTEPVPAAPIAPTGRIAQPNASLLDSPVSRTAYLLGPGDILDLSTFGEIGGQSTLTVTPEGTLIIPRLGSVDVLGTTIEQAESRVVQLLSRFYRNFDVRLSLSEVRSFKVFVLGDVPEPGVRVASAATRVSEVVPSVGADSSGKRNVVIRRASGDTIAVDLARFRQVGDMSQNPLLQEGDVVLLPVMDETVTVMGRVAFPGVYQFRPGESLAEFLSTVNGGGSFLADAADTVRLTRYLDDERSQTQSFPRAEALGSPLLLQPFDAIYVPAVANFREQRSATVVGQVRRPGTYPIEPGITTVSELVAMAGGFTTDASLTETTLRRSTRGASDLLRRLEAVPPEALSPEEQTIVRVVTQDGPEHVVVDFTQLAAPGSTAAYDPAVETGDVLTVPRLRDDVIVLGAVLEPGIVAFSYDRPARAFIDLAGGFSANADRGSVTVVKARTGARIHWRDADRIDPGDRIIVPFKEHRTFLERVQTTQGILGTISGIVLTIVGLGRIF